MNGTEQSSAPLRGTKNTNNGTATLVTGAKSAESPWRPPGAEPLYIEESDGFSLLRKVYNFENLKTQKGHLELGFSLLKHTLYLMYGNTEIEPFIEETSNSYQLSEQFSTTMKQIIDINQWGRNTASIALTSLKKILKETTISQAFLQRLTIPSTKKISKTSLEFNLPRKFKQTTDDCANCNDPSGANKKALLTLLQDCKDKSKYKSQDSLSSWIAFIVQLLEHLEIEPKNYKNIMTQFTFDDLIQAVKLIRPNYELNRKLQFLEVLICNILENGDLLEKFKLLKKTTQKTRTQIEETDVHRLSVDELEAMFESSKANLLDEILFMLMITTGLRAGGVSNIKLENVVTFVNNKMIVKQNGRTLEKGGKWFTFVINKRVNELLEKWIETGRKSMGSYLFPGRGEDIGISTHRINTIIKNIGKRAGIEGPHVHAHSLRHTFAHNLLEEGNKPELVSKMLGHASSLTTEKYYLKESAAEVSTRLNIPWLSREKANATLPSFLKDDGLKEKVKDEKNKKKKITKSDKQKLFMQLKTGMSLSNIEE